MKQKRCKSGILTFRNKTVKILVYFFIVVLIANLDAIVDTPLHPGMAYFEFEHLLVGGVTGLVCAILFGLILLYTHHLEQALSKIKVLESFLPICSHCKKIRIADKKAMGNDSWQQIDDYISQNTNTSFTHGICPDCLKKYYSEYMGEVDAGDNTAG